MFYAKFKGGVMTPNVAYQPRGFLRWLN